MVCFLPARKEIFSVGNTLIIVEIQDQKQRHQMIMSSAGEFRKFIE